MFILSCNLESGLGPKVDAERPVLEITSPDSGQNVGGNVTLSGTFNDDVEVDKITLDFLQNNVIVTTKDATIDASNKT